MNLSRSPRSELTDLRILTWLATSNDPLAFEASDWPGNFGLSTDEVERQLSGLAGRDLVVRQSTLATTHFSVSGAGRGHLNELTQPARLSALRSAFLRDAWIELLYANGCQSIGSRCLPMDQFENEIFTLAEATPEMHEGVLDYLQTKGLIESQGAWGAPFLFAWLTPNGLDCAEAGASVAAHLDRSSSGNFTQTNTFTNVAAAAAGRDGVSASATLNVGPDVLADLRSKLDQIQDADDREEGLLILADVQDAVQTADRSHINKRANQLLRFAGRLGERTLAVAIEAIVKAQFGGPI